MSTPTASRARTSRSNGAPRSMWRDRSAPLRSRRRRPSAGSCSLPAAPASRRFAPCFTMRWRFPTNTIGLFYSARTPDEFAYEYEFRALAQEGRIELRQTVTRARPTPHGAARAAESVAPNCNRSSTIRRRCASSADHPRSSPKPQDWSASWESRDADPDRALGKSAALITKFTRTRSLGSLRDSVFVSFVSSVFAAQIRRRGIRHRPSALRR